MEYPNEKEYLEELAYLHARKAIEEEQQWYEELERSQKPAKIEVVKIKQKEYAKKS